MTAIEQTQVKEKYYAEAMRYMDNAKETLKKAGKEDYRYKDKKYVKTACGTAYNGVLIAVQGLFILKGVKQPKKREDKMFYTDNLSKINPKYNNIYEDLYSVLHLSGYYDGIQDAKIIQRGFELAYELIEKINPKNLN